MRRYIGMGILFLLALLLQSTLFNYLAVYGVKPDLVLILVIYFAFTNGPWRGAVIGMTFGLLEDFYVGRFVGMNFLALLVVGLVAGWLETKLYKNNLLIALVVVYIISALGQSIVLLSGAAAGLNWNVRENFSTVMALALYNACLVPVSYPLFHRSVTKGILRLKLHHEQK